MRLARSLATTSADRESGVRPISSRSTEAGRPYRACREASCRNAAVQSARVSSSCGGRPRSARAPTAPPSDDRLVPCRKAWIRASVRSSGWSSGRTKRRDRLGFRWAGAGRWSADSVTPTKSSRPGPVGLAPAVSRPLPLGWPPSWRVFPPGTSRATLPNRHRRASANWARRPRSPADERRIACRARR